jgi:outer membrane receptor protein involved in Fe transport
VSVTGRPYDPASVVAIVDGRIVNATRERYRGVDFNIVYSFDLAEASTLRILAAGSYLDSSQQLLPGLPTTQLSGTIFNPPRFRGRGGATWSDERLSISGFVNFAGAVTDRRRAVPVPGRSLTTLDATVRFELRRDLSVALVVRNLFNAKPEPIFTAVVSDTPFDTTNYSAEGRFVGVSVTGAWQ